MLNKTFFCLAAVLCVAGTPALAQPTFGNPSPNAGSSTSQQANAAADAAAYKEVDYVNKGKRGPALVVIPGEVKSNNASFMQKFGPNNIADFGELNADDLMVPRADIEAVAAEIAPIVQPWDWPIARRARAAASA